MGYLLHQSSAFDLGCFIKGDTFMGKLFWKANIYYGESSDYIANFMTAVAFVKKSHSEFSLLDRINAKREVYI